MKVLVDLVDLAALADPKVLEDLEVQKLSKCARTTWQP